MNRIISLILALALLAANAVAATVNWSAGINNGLSLADGTNVPAGSLARVGYFRNAGTGVPLTDTEIQSLANSPTVLNNSFVEAGATTIGSGVGGVAGHFDAAGNADTSTTVLNLEGKQIYVWVLNAATLAGATQQGIFYWDIGNTAKNPDGTFETLGARWKFPAQSPVPWFTTIDLTDLTTGTGTLAAGAHVVVGTFPAGISTTTSAPNFGLAPIDATLTVATSSPLTGGTVGFAFSQTLAASGGTAPYMWSVSVGSLPPGLALTSAGVPSGTLTATGARTSTNTAPAPTRNPPPRASRS